MPITLAIFLLGNGIVENLINLILLALIGYFVFLALTGLKRLVRLSRLEYKLYEIKLPKGLRDTSEISIRFFRVLSEMLCRNETSVVLEIASDGTNGTRYLARVPSEEKDEFKTLVKSMGLGFSLNEVEDYLTKGKYRSKDLRISRAINSERMIKDKYGFTNQLHGILNDIEESESLSLRLICSGYRSGIYDRILKQSNTEPIIKVHVRISETRNCRRLGSVLSAIRTLALPARNVSISLTDAFPFMGSNLTISEVSCLYCFPEVQTAGLNVQQFNELPLPVKRRSLKADVSYGINDVDGMRRPIGLTQEERKRHVFISGGTGNGKSTLLLQSLVQDAKSGKGIALIDPHGDLCEDFLSRIPRSRIKEVVYFNPSDILHPIGINLMELSGGLSKDEKLAEQDLITEAIISIFRKVFSDNENGGARLEYLLRNAIQTSFNVEGATLFTVYRLLTEAKYRARVVSELKDKTLIHFWDNEFSKAGDMQRVKLSIGITSKLGRYLRSTSTRRILGQNKSALNFDDILNGQKILVCNLSKGKLGEDTSSVLGISVLAMIQLAAYRRQSLPFNARSTFNLYVDEFQNFATTSFSQMLSEARKFGLSLTIAEQSVSQQAEDVISTILTNVGTLVAFRCGSPMDEKVLLPLFMPVLEKGDLLNLPAYRFYIRIASEEVLPPISGITVLPKQISDRGTFNEVVARSRDSYSMTAS